MRRTTNLKNSIRHSIPTIRIVPATPTPRGVRTQTMTMAPKDLPVSLHSLEVHTSNNSTEPPPKATWLSRGFDPVDDESFEGFVHTSNGDHDGVEYRNMDETFIEEDSIDVTPPTSPKSPRPDSPYPLESVNSRVSEPSSPRPRMPAVKRSSFTTHIPEAIRELVVPNSASLITAMHLGPKEKFENGYFKRVRKFGWVSRFLCSAPDNDEDCCTECGTDWKIQSYGQRCDCGFHFKDEDGKVYEFVGEKFLFEEGTF